MVDYVRFKSLAKRLIETNGRSITLLRSGNTPVDSNKPWRGSTNQASNSTSFTITTIGLFVHPFLDSDLLSLVSSIESPYNTTRDSENVLIHADLLDGVAEAEIESFDLLKDGNTLYKINRVKLLSPGSVRIAYALEVSQ
jgi:hypothetical protein